MAAKPSTADDASASQMLPSETYGRYDFSVIPACVGRQFSRTFVRTACIADASLAMAARTTKSMPIERLCLLTSSLGGKRTSGLAIAGTTNDAVRPYIVDHLDDAAATVVDAWKLLL